MRRPQTIKLLKAKKAIGKFTVAMKKQILHTILSRKLRYWFGVKRLWLAIFIGSLLALAFPLFVERQSEHWDSVRARESSLYWQTLSHYYQLNIDQPGWMAVIANFPRAYWADKTRINRPVYPAISSIICRLAGFPLLKFKTLTTPCPIPLAWGAGLMVNWLILVFSVFAFYHLLLGHHFPETIASLSTIQLALSPLVIWHLADVATNIATVGIVVASLWLFTLLYQTSSQKEIDWYSLGLGLLMLVKGQYDTLFAGWTALIYLGRWGTVLRSFVVHFIPLLCWIGLLNLWGLNYYNHEVAAYRQLVWVWEEFIYWPFRDQIVYLGSYTITYLSNFLLAFGSIVAGLSIVGFWQLVEQYPTNYWRFSLISIFLNWLFLFAILRSPPYLVATIFFIIYPLAAIGISWLASKFGETGHDLTIVGYLIVNTIFVLITTIPERFLLKWPHFLLELF